MTKSNCRQFTSVPRGPDRTAGSSLRSPVGIVTAALPQIREYAPEIQQAVRELDLAAINKLEKYAFALYHTHALFLGSGEATSELQQAVEQGVKLRQLLLADANTLAGRGLIEPSRLKRMQGPVGFNNIGTDLATLNAVLKDSWPKIQGKTAVTLQEIEQALRLSQQIIVGVGARTQGGVIVSTASDLRLRAFTLLARHYDKIRRAVSFLRWDNEDAEKVAPSLYSGRGGGRHQPDEPVNPGPPVVVPPAPPPGPQPPVTEPKPVLGAAHTATEAKPGSPDAEPFLK